MRSDASREAITQVLENGLERETEGSESGDEKNAHEQENQGILRQALSTSSSQMTVSDVHRIPLSLSSRLMWRVIYRVAEGRSIRLRA